MLTAPRIPLSASALVIVCLVGCAANPSVEGSAAARLPCGASRALLELGRSPVTKVIGDGPLTSRWRVLAVDCRADDDWQATVQQMHEGRDIDGYRFFVRREPSIGVPRIDGDLYRGMLPTESRIEAAERARLNALKQFPDASTNGTQVVYVLPDGRDQLVLAIRLEVGAGNTREVILVSVDDGRLLQRRAAQQ